jgi:membrane protease subunit (stomatin/prohibitin family)
LSVSDPIAMILKLVGTRQATNDLITDWAREQILKALRTGLVKKLTAEKWPVLGLAARTDVLETTLIADVQAPLAPYGINITRLGNMTISLSPEDEQTLKGLRKDTAYSRLAGGFREYGVGAALKGIGEGAAAGNGGGAAVLGVGMGLGGLVGGIGIASPPGGSPGAGPAPPTGPSSGGGAAGVVCASCHAPNAPGAKFCSSCGTSLTPKAVHCTQCGTAGAPGAKFCANCGGALS